jgi:gallate decarboxylase subunit C
MAKKDVSSMRGTLEWLKSQGELLEVDNEIDVIYEIAGVQAAMEGGPPLVFNNIKGFPGKRDVGNIFTREKNVCGMFDVKDFKELRKKCWDAMKHPLPPKVVTEAPSQEVVITKDIDVLGTIPITKYHPSDAGRILPSGNWLLTGKYTNGGTHIAFTRTHFRGKDWGAAMPSIGSTTEEISWRHRGEKIPVTLNICNSPAVLMVASTGFVHAVVPLESDKLGFAGALQGAPVNIVKAKTVDAMAVAEAEWVIEGYLNTKEKVWESDEAEKLGQQGIIPYFQEWTGYVGSAWRGYKLEVTAITHRKDRPMFFTPFSRSPEADNMCSPFRAAAFMEMAERTSPGLVVDANTIPGAAAWGGSIIFQVNKSAYRYEGYQRTILAAAIANSFTLKLAAVVDEDVDITSADDILWAIATRCNPGSGVITGAGGKVLSMMPLEKVGSSKDVKVGGYRIEGTIGLDCTLPFLVKQSFNRTHYPVDRVDLKKYFTQKQIDDVRATQHGYVKLWAERGG